VNRGVIVCFFWALALSLIVPGAIVHHGIVHSAAGDLDNGLVWSTFLGGSGVNKGQAIAVDGEGNVYVAGAIYELDFPVSPGAFDPNFNGAFDAFLAKLNPEGTTLLYGTYLGGDSTDWCWDIVVNDAGEAYVCGDTWSFDFPTTEGAFDRSFNGYTFYGGDVFVTKINAAGTDLVYSTFLGGWYEDWGGGIDIDDQGYAYIAGQTCSNDFPTTPGAFDRHQDGDEAFVSKLNPTASALIYSTYLGGASEDDGAQAIAVDDSGYVYLGGFTASMDFPVSANAFDSTKNGSEDGFVAKLNREGSALIYGTYLGGGSNDWVWDIAIDDQGFLYAAGVTHSMDFPVTPGSFDLICNGSDGYAVKINQTGSAIEYGTFLGGSDIEDRISMSIDGSGHVYVIGETRSIDFPVTPEAFDMTFNGDVDVFLTKLGQTGSALAYSTYLGGVGEDGSWGWGKGDVTVDSAGMVYVTGGTGSSDFPVTSGALDTVYNLAEAYIAKFDLRRYPVPVILADFQSSGGSGMITLQWTTASEIDCYCWEIHRSSQENGDFKKIGQVHGRGTDESPYTYWWVDRQVTTGLVYFYKLKQVDFDGSQWWSYTVSAAATSEVPQSYVLRQNHPNPFNAVTGIGYQLPEAGPVILKIFNTLGQEVRTLVNGPQEAGEYTVRWDGRDAGGRETASGLYFCRMESGEYITVIKLVLLR